MGISWPLTGQRLGGGAFVRLAARHSDRIPNRKVITVPIVAIRAWLRQRNLRTTAERFQALQDIGSWFARACLRHLHIAHRVFYGFSSASLEAIRFENRQGVRAIVSQVDAARTHGRILREEEALFPELVEAATCIQESYYSRLEEEWSEADCVAVNSLWTRRALLEQGVAASKIAVLPIAYEATKLVPHARTPRVPLRVLWLGALTLAKGLPYALQAAKLLARAPIQFTFAGPAAVTLKRLSWPANCTYAGPLPRPQALKLYQHHDVFLFPTLSDGFGLTQVEAIAHGLPVIATPCCGDVIEHGTSGFRVNPRDPRAIADAILELLESGDRLYRMSCAALERSRDFRAEAVWPLYAQVLGIAPADAGVQAAGRDPARSLQKDGARNAQASQVFGQS